MTTAIQSDKRSVATGLSGLVNLEILGSVMGQLSDGKWENSPGMERYWKYASVGWLNGEVVIVLESSYRSGFSGKDAAWVKSWFAGKIKAIAQDELEGSQLGWDRANTRELGYLGDSKTPVTVGDAYRAYDVLKGRDVSKKVYAKGRSAEEIRQSLIVAAERQVERAAKELFQAEAALNYYKTQLAAL